MTATPLRKLVILSIFRDLVTLHESDFVWGEKTTEAMQMQVVCVAARAAAPSAVAAERERERGEKV